MVSHPLITSGRLPAITRWCPLCCFPATPRRAMGFTSVEFQSLSFLSTRADTSTEHPQPDQVASVLHFFCLSSTYTQLLPLQSYPHLFAVMNTVILNNPQLTFLLLTQQQFKRPKENPLTHTMDSRKNRNKLPGNSVF